MHGQHGRLPLCGSSSLDCTCSRGRCLSAVSCTISAGPGCLCSMQSLIFQHTSPAHSWLSGVPREGLEAGKASGRVDLELACRHFFYILLAQVSHQASPDPVMGRSTPLSHRRSCKVTSPSGLDTFCKISITVTLRGIILTISFGVGRSLYDGNWFLFTTGKCCLPAPTKNSMPKDMRQKDAQLMLLPSFLSRSTP